MASGDRHRLTFRGPNEPYYGYGRTYVSLRENLETCVDLVDDAPVCVDVKQPNMVKGWHRGQYRSCLTMWETTVLPDKFALYSKQFDQIIVPCQHNKELFSEYNPNTVVVPLGVDMAMWKPGRRPKNEQITFLAGGSHWLRKGLDRVVEAFGKWGNVDARLILKCTPETIGGVPKIVYPNVQVIAKWMSVEDEVELYRSADCFVAASRGEGWGLMPLQAMCLGLPTIMTATTGHNEFAAYATWIVETKSVPVSLDRFYKTGNWDEPDIESLIAGFQHVADNLDKAWKDAKAFLPEVRRFDWANSTKRLLEVLPMDYATEIGPWELAGEVHVEVVVSRRVVADIGKYHVDLAPGATHSVPINVRDTIRDAGYLVENDGNVQR